MPATDSPAMSPAGTLAAQKLEALRQTQSQAEHRVKIGAQLLKAAQAHTEHTRSYVEQVRLEQNELREKLEKDVAAALHQYDQWVGTIDENLTRRLEKIEKRLEGIERHWSDMESRVMKLVRRSEALMDRSQAIMEVVAELDSDELEDAAASNLPPSTSTAAPSIAPKEDKTGGTPANAKKPNPGKAPVVKPSGKRKDNLYTRLIRDLNQD